MARENWTEEQITTVVLYEYCRNPFGQFSATKPFVKELGELLGRTPGAIKGKERKQKVTRRINQDFFRRTVLSSYNNCCCITGINNKSLLEASHIVGWTKDEANRTNPQNGLCLNVLFHKAYDENLIGISPDYEIFVSDEFFGAKLENVDSSTKEYIKSINHRKLIMPKRFLPNRDLLAIHFEKYCK